MCKPCILLLLVICIAWTRALPQRSEVTPLFQNEEPLSIRLAYSFKEIVKNKADSVYLPTMLFYKNNENTWDSIAIRIRGRGDFRRRNCFFTPIRIKIKKGDTKNTLFDGNKNLKLVLPCQPADSYNELVLREYLCYQFYEPATPYTFNTRLLDVTLSNEGKKNDKTYQVKGFFIEDDDKVAKRFHGKVLDGVKLNPYQLNDTSTLRHDFFEFMIANTDWSSSFQHNNKVIKTEPRTYIPIAYDFDMAGFVDAPYSTYSETLGISSVRERVFRGYCRSEDVTRFVRAEYIKAKPDIMGVFDRYESYFNPKEFAGMKKYILEFFDILENEKTFSDKVLKACRTN
jgi:hypothetical protein